MPNPAGPERGARCRLPQMERGFPSNAQCYYSAADEFTALEITSQMLINKINLK